MYQRGAKHFIFLSRSGADNPSAAALLQALHADPTVTTAVVRGSVTNLSDVHAAVAHAHHPLRGIVQAATTFHDRLFASMDTHTWHAVIGPKVQGTINLLRATHTLDFFITTSSTIGVIGTPTQSHYAAANAFLDTSPTTSLSLGMVVGLGHVVENPGKTLLLPCHRLM